MIKPVSEFCLLPPPPPPPAAPPQVDGPAEKDPFELACLPLPPSMLGLDVEADELEEEGGRTVMLGR